MLTIKCIKELQTKYLTFKSGEEYIGNKINNNYWIIDSVGVKTKIFEEHFVVITKEDEKTE